MRRESIGSGAPVRFALVLWVLAGLAVSGPGGTLAQTRPPIGIVEKLGQTIPRDLTLIDEDGNAVTVGSLLGKPTVLTFVYYRCPGTVPRS